MKNYQKPMLVENTTTKFESVYAASGDVSVKCKKRFNQYSADWNCGSCQYYIQVPGWSWLNDECGLAK